MGGEPGEPIGDSLFGFAGAAEVGDRAAFRVVTAMRQGVIGLGDQRRGQNGPRDEERGCEAWGGWPIHANGVSVERRRAGIVPGMRGVCGAGWRGTSPTAGGTVW